MDLMKHLASASVLLAGFAPGLSASAEAPEFVIINSEEVPDPERIFLKPFGANTPIRVEASDDALDTIEASFERAAQAHEDLYRTAFDTSVAPRIDWGGFKSIVPIYISEDFPSVDPEFPVMSVEGPAIYQDGYYYLRSSTPLIRKSYINGFQKDTPAAGYWLASSVPDLPISHSIAAFHQASQCRNWPIRPNTSDEISLVMAQIGRRTSTMKFFATITNAKALQGLGAMDERVRSGYRAVTVVAQAIARAEAFGMPAKDVEAEIEKWLGASSMRIPAFRANWPEADVPTAFADPLLLTLMSSDSPETIYGLTPLSFNALAEFDTSFACAGADDYREHPFSYVDAFQDAFDREALRIGRSDMKLAEVFVHAQLHKAYLPQITANQMREPIENYDETFLDPDTWISRVFKSASGMEPCITVDFADKDWHEESGEFNPLTVRCFRIMPKDVDEVRNFTVSLTVEGSNIGEADYEAFRLKPSDGNIGIVSKSNAVTSDQSGEYLKTWLFDTEPHSEPALREDDGSKLLFLFNVADRLSETKTHRVKVDFVLGGAKNTITAIRRVQENGRNKPATEYRLPSMPSDLTTRVSFDLQSAEEYADPKLILTYTYVKGMEAMMGALAKTISTATAPVTGLKHPMMLKDGKTEIDLIEEQASTVQSLADQLKLLQAGALNNRFPETVNVVIEAPAPSPGFTGTLNDVLISVNWTDETGRPHDVESIGPEDMSAAPSYEIYLNNGTLNISRFDRSVFIAEYEGELTHEPVLPPMQARKPHLNRDVAGYAKGTVVATGYDVALNGDREAVGLAQDFETLGATGERLRASREPTKEEMAGQGRTGNAERQDVARVGIGNAPGNCNCSCDTYWEANVSRACTSLCRVEYKICRAQTPANRPERFVEHAEAIAFFWEAMGITTPETQATSREQIIAMSESEFQALLDGVEMIGGPKAK